MTVGGRECPTGERTYCPISDSASSLFAPGFEIIGWCVVPVLPSPPAAVTGIFPLRDDPSPGPPPILGFRPLHHRARGGARRDGDGVPGAGHPPPSSRRPQGAPPRARAEPGTSELQSRFG